MKTYSLQVSVYFEAEDDDAANSAALAFVGNAPLPPGDSDCEPVVLYENLPEGGLRSVADY